MAARKGQLTLTMTIPCGSPEAAAVFTNLVQGFWATLPSDGVAKGGPIGDGSWFDAKFDADVVCRNEDAKPFRAVVTKKLWARRVDGGSTSTTSPSRKD
jgi:hypothetical protein